MADRPPNRVPGHVERIPTPVSSPKQDAQFEVPAKLSEEEATQLDQECYERFIKVNVKHITDGQGVVSGVLLVTPNAVMFDPNVSDPLVLEHGAEHYGVIAPMDMVVSAAMYHDIAAMKVKGQKGEQESLTPKPEVYHDKSCQLYKSWCEGHNKEQDAEDSDKPDSEQGAIAQTDKNKLLRGDSVCSCGPNQNIPPMNRDDQDSSTGIHLQGNLSIAENEEVSDSQTMEKDLSTEKTDPEASGNLEMTPLIDFGDFVSAETVEGESGKEESKTVNSEQNTVESEEDTIVSEHNVSYSPQQDQLITKDEPNIGKDGQEGVENVTSDTGTNLPATEKTSKISNTSKDTESVMKTHTEKLKNEFELKPRSQSSPIEIQKKYSSKRTSSTSSPDTKSSSSFGSFNVTPHLNAFVNYATGLFKSSDVKDIGEAGKNAASESDKVKTSDDSHDGTRKATVTAHMQDNVDLEVAVENAVKLADKPELFQSFDKLIPRPATTFEDPPLYLCLRLGKPINKNVSQTAPIQAYSKKKKKPEYWFSIPRDKVDQLYAFFVKWKPEIYGDEEEVSAENRGFVVLDEDSTPDEMEIHEDYFNSHLQKDWEIISADEALRRKSMDVDEALLMPEMIGESTILQDFHIQMINKHMPARTVGYPWTLNYSTDQHGFSLKTLYRDMHKMDSPVLMVVKDTRDNIFGALTSCELKQSDHFYGTGESFLFTFWPEFKVFRWTGDNSLFIKGSSESIAIGAGQGLFGLWLDGDLYHGRTNRCETYDNDVLTESEDFVVKAFEAWIFIQD
ncbi:hypothetical protein FSP39_000610 [Pinctada imbricata]|uniref:Oxidation resistance protein 1 n=1 Tax=Pinctada imbricata TaxID=66713 RepID=A0AA89BMM9_PINIB|nr:hypothetical protein FSP39_000610 [Pinctada imbricata]